MAAAIVKKYNLTAKGILVAENNTVGLEITDSGEFIDMYELLSDFDGKPIKLSVSYDEEYNTTIDS